MYIHIYVYIYTYILRLIYKKRDLPFDSSSPKWSHLPGLGQAETRRDLSWSPMWTAGVQVLGPSSTAFPGTSVRNWIGSRAEMQATTAIWDVGITNTDFTHCHKAGPKNLSLQPFLSIPFSSLKLVHTVMPPLSFFFFAIPNPSLLPRYW